LKIVDSRICDRLQTMLPQDENTARQVQFMLPPAASTPPITVSPPMARRGEEESIAVGYLARRRARGEKNGLQERFRIKDGNTLTEINISMKALLDSMNASWEKPLTYGADTMKRSS
jgi:hypothetical protein